MKKRVLLVRHGGEPSDDRVTTWLIRAGYEIDTRKPFAGDLLGEVTDDLAGTVLYGGKYDVKSADEHPFLTEEYRWIEACLKSDVPMLGLCQGAQLIAHHLGAAVGPQEGAPHEFGYYPVAPTAEAAGFLDEQMWFTQAHFHTFDLPDGTVCLAGNQSFTNQAFRYGDKVFGLQFHPEVTIEGFRRWQQDLAFMYGQPGVQTAEQQTKLMLEHDAKQAQWFYGVLDTLFGSKVPNVV